MVLLLNVECVLTKCGCCAAACALACAGCMRAGRGADLDELHLVCLVSRDALHVLKGLGEGVAQVVHDDHRVAVVQQLQDGVAAYGWTGGTQAGVLGISKLHGCWCSSQQHASSMCGESAAGGGAGGWTSGCCPLLASTTAAGGRDLAPGSPM